MCGGVATRHTPYCSDQPLQDTLESFSGGIAICVGLVD